MDEAKELKDRMAKKLDFILAGKVVPIRETEQKHRARHRRNCGGLTCLAIQGLNDAGPGLVTSHFHLVLPHLEFTFTGLALLVLGSGFTPELHRQSQRINAVVLAERTAFGGDSGKPGTSAAFVPAIGVVQSSRMVLADHLR